ncbi:hypothetical protein JG688_00011453 [Phytophthora aleatoria]|uniref:RxLR effector protein n=1 Tax=Phytophthora aleatoria TaxID=2496075 RepID=A0A8J5ITT9_9STRA|nr:hypothetical protein JG688_00011453 [Phytophthora aleatoria]
MRRLFYAVFLFAIILVTCSSAITATTHSDQAKVASLNEPGFLHVGAETIADEYRRKLFRANDAGDNTILVSAANQQRGLKATPLDMLGKKFKSTRAGKKLTAAAKTTSATFKRIPGVKITKNRILYNKFSRWAKQGKRLEDLKAAGKFKNNDEVAMYQVILNSRKPQV